MHLRAEKLRSAVHVVIGMVKYNLRSLSTSERRSLAVGITVNISAMILTLVMFSTDNVCSFW